MGQDLGRQTVLKQIENWLETDRVIRSAQIGRNHLSIVHVCIRTSECRRAQSVDVVSTDGLDSERSRRQGVDLTTEVRGRAIGLLFFSKRQTTPAGEIAAAVERVADAYSTPTQIEEGLPGQWV